jgi:hypothetical protein
MSLSRFFSNLYLVPKLKPMETQSLKNERPGFLTVMCIISFVGLGLSILNNIKLFIFGELGSNFYAVIQTHFEESINQVHASNPGIAPFLEKIFESVLKLVDLAPLLATISIVASVIALAGVILMWKLIKSGFYIYSAIKILLVFIPMTLIGINFVSILLALGSIFTAAIFITLYALNLKALK